MTRLFIITVAILVLILAAYLATDEDCTTDSECGCILNCLE